MDLQPITFEWIEGSVVAWHWVHSWSKQVNSVDGYLLTSVHLLISYMLQRLLYSFVSTSYALSFYCSSCTVLKLIVISTMLRYVVWYRLGQNCWVPFQSFSHEPSTCSWLFQQCMRNLLMIMISDWATPTILETMSRQLVLQRSGTSVTYGPQSYSVAFLIIWQVVGS